MRIILWAAAATAAGCCCAEFCKSACQLASQLAIMHFPRSEPCSYEGLMLEDIPHNKGTLVFGNGLGGGIQSATKGDKYEGEFDSGFAHGLAQYTGKKGRVYRGEYTAGLRHGYVVQH